MDAETFHATYLAGRDHSWEEEEAYFDWVTALQMVAEMEEEIVRLEEILLAGMYANWDLGPMPKERIQSIIYQQKP